MSIYKDLYDLIEKEMHAREDLEEFQRPDKTIESKALKTTKQCIGDLLEKIEYNLI